MLNDNERPLDSYSRDEENAANEEVLGSLGLVPTTDPGHVHAYRYDHHRTAWFCRVDDCNEEK